MSHIVHCTNSRSQKPILITSSNEAGQSFLRRNFIPFNNGTIPGQVLRCRAKNCRKNHDTHYCSNCGMQNSNHKSSECTKKSSKQVHFVVGQPHGHGHLVVGHQPHGHFVVGQPHGHGHFVVGHQPHGHLVVSQSPRSHLVVGHQHHGQVFVVKR